MRGTFWRRLAFVAVSCAAVGITFVLQSTQARIHRPPEVAAPAAPGAKARLARAYEQLPLSFERNTGQTDPRVQFLARGNGYAMFLTRGQAVLALAADAASPRSPGGRPAGSRESVLRMQLVGGSARTRVEGLGRLPGNANYLIGNDPKRWHTLVPTYAKVAYKSVYPGIDLTYYGNQGQLEYDFTVAPGADPNAIALRFRGVGTVKLDGRGDLVLRAADGSVRLRRPLLYQEVGRSRRAVAGGYTLDGSHAVGFRVGAYDPSRPLIVDPVLVYSTFLGGSGADIGPGLAIDGSGSAYVTGWTESADFPTTAGAFDTSANGGPRDAFVTKLNETGSALVYSTYLGGSAEDDGNAIAVDASGSAYVTGFTASADFPTTPGAFDTSFNGVFDVFVTKLNPAGTGLLYSTFLGGSNFDATTLRGKAIAVDATGSAYVTGFTDSADFPTTPGAFDTRINGRDVFVTKLNPAGTGLVYSTYLGGSGEDIGWGIAVDATGYAYLTGVTESADFPTTPGAFQTALKGSGDAFVTKLNQTGSALVYSTYLGGSGAYPTQAGIEIAVDASGSAYVVGETPAADFPTTPGAFDTSFNGGAGDAFVTKLDPTGSTLVYSTYLGGNGEDGGFGIAIDAAGSAYVTGITSSADFPTTPGALQTSLNGSADAFVTKLNAAGTGLLYSTYLGGSAFDQGYGIAIDSSGSAYVAGETDSTDFPTTAGAFDTTFNGVADAFVTKLALATAAPQSTPGKATGGGYIDPLTGQLVDQATMLIQSGSPTASINDKATFGFGVQFDAGDAAPNGNLTYNDHSANETIKVSNWSLLQIRDSTTAECPLGGKHATIKGTGTENGSSGHSVRVEVDDCDAGSPAPDRFEIHVDEPTGYFAVGYLIGGDIQVTQS